MILISLLLLFITLSVLLKYLNYKNGVVKEIEFHKQNAFLEKSNKDKLEEEFLNKLESIKQSFNGLVTEEIKKNVLNFENKLQLINQNLSDKDERLTNVEDLLLELQENMENEDDQNNQSDQKDEENYNDEDLTEEKTNDLEPENIIGNQVDGVFSLDEKEFNKENEISQINNEDLEEKNTDLRDENNLSNLDFSKSNTILNSIEIIKPKNETTLEPKEINLPSKDIEDFLNEDLKKEDSIIKPIEEQNNLEEPLSNDFLNNEIDNALENLRNMNMIKAKTSAEEESDNTLKIVQLAKNSSNSLSDFKEEENSSEEMEENNSDYSFDLNDIHLSNSEDAKEEIPSELSSKEEKLLSEEEIDLSNSIENLKTKMNYQDTTGASTEDTSN